VSVITVYRQVGSRGRYIAENVARTLDCHFTDYQNVERILLQYGYSQVREVYETAPDFWDRFTRKGPERDTINALLRSVTRAEAHHGNVVMLGRGCFAALQGLSDVFNVRLKAPLDLRIERVMQDQQMTRDEATAFVTEKDKLVHEFVKSSYGASPDDCGMFDVVIDTAKVDPDAVVLWLAEAARALPRPGDPRPSAASLDVDPVIATAVSHEFERMVRLRAERKAPRAEGRQG
jgi:cytidylate kinase